jgi:hypothetical protein
MTMDRKEFIRISGRWMILSLVVVFGAGLIIKRRVSTGSTCNISDPCSKCGSLSSCNLPKAVKYKKNEQEKGF